MLSTIGVSIYLHYCGGNLEKVNYIIKSKGCCGDDDEDSSKNCCRTEQVVVKNAAHFTFNKDTTHDLKPLWHFHLFLPFNPNAFLLDQTQTVAPKPDTSPPPGFQHSLIITTIVLRV